MILLGLLLFLLPEIYDGWERIPILRHHLTLRLWEDTL
jgi:hypothetical protein